MNDDAPIYLPNDLRLVNQICNDLFRDKASIKDLPEWTGDLPEQFFLSTYKTDGGKLAAYCILEFLPAAWFAALLVGHQRETVDEAVSSKKLNQELSENLSEAMNIASRLFNKEYFAHIVFEKTISTSFDALDETTKTLINQPIARLDGQVKINGVSDMMLIHFYQVTK